MTVTDAKAALVEVDVASAARSHWELLQRRAPRETKVRVLTAAGATHSVVEIVTDDMPFLVDSVAMALTRRGSAIHLFLHPVVKVRRDEEGRLLELLPW